MRVHVYMMACTWCDCMCVFVRVCHRRAGGLRCVAAQLPHLGPFPAGMQPPCRALRETDLYWPYELTPQQQAQASQCCSRLAWRGSSGTLPQSLGS